jgi:hypothetical protein
LNIYVVVVVLLVVVVVLGNGFGVNAPGAVQGEPQKLLLG